MNPVLRTVDPITFQILSHKLYQIAKEMGTTLERAPLSVWKDVESGFVSKDAAQEVYGVIIHNGDDSFDAHATTELRRRLWQERTKESQ